MRAPSLPCISFIIWAIRFLPSCSDTRPALVSAINRFIDPTSASYPAIAICLPKLVNFISPFAKPSPKAVAIPGSMALRSDCIPIVVSLIFLPCSPDKLCKYACKFASLRLACKLAAISFRCLPVTCVNAVNVVRYSEVASARSRCDIRSKNPIPRCISRYSPMYSFVSLAVNPKLPKGYNAFRTELLNCPIALAPIATATAEFLATYSANSPTDNLASAAILVNEPNAVSPSLKPAAKFIPVSYN